MPCPHKKHNPRKHTPITSERQRKLFGAALVGKAYKAPSLSRTEARRHLREVKGKKLPARAKKKKRKGNPRAFEEALLKKYRVKKT